MTLLKPTKADAREWLKDHPGLPPVKQKKQRYLVLDYETRSECDITATGAYEYAVHPTTRLMCVSWKLGELDELKALPELVWSPMRPSPYGELKNALLDKSVMLVAHNAFFEQCITKFVFSKIINDPYLKNIPIERWICTASLARSMALPGKLEQACLALNLPVKKDMDGHKLMMKMAKPRKSRREERLIDALENQARTRWHNKVSDLDRLMEYCKTDVRAETLLLLSTAPLIPTERKLWELDQRINFRGFRVDRDLVKKSLRLISEEITALDLETQELTSGQLRSTTQRVALLKFVQKCNIALPDMKAKTVADALAGGVAHPKAKRLLEIRQAVSKSSTAKYAAFESRTRHDGYSRDNLVFHLAGTGRWGGAGVQPQNFPRGNVKDTWQAIDILKESELPFIRAVYEHPMNVLSSCLRGCIIPSDGKDFFCGDYASIEVRVLFWLADHKAGLKAYLEGRDLYCEMAAEIYNRSISFYDKDPKTGKRSHQADAEREVGKRAILGCGYGMGWKKFKETCITYGMPVTDELAQRAVVTYRKVHSPVTRLWKNLELAAMAAINNPGKAYTINKTKWFVKGKFLFCKLPGGRKLAYYGAAIETELTRFGPRPRIVHWGVNPKTRQWAKEHTWGGKFTENADSAIARDNMGEAMVRLENAGFEIVLTVHDEILAEKKNGDVKEFEKLMATTEEWANGLPVKVDAWTGHRYRK